MNCRCSRSPILLDFYRRYLEQANISDFERSVSSRYSAGALEHLAHHYDVNVRRAAVLALGLVGTMSSNTLLASLLTDDDRTTATLAESAIRNVWRRDGDEDDQRALQNLLRLTANGEAVKTVTYASLQLEKTPKFAEIWFQRARAWFELGEFKYALEDLEKTLDLNPFHFNAYVLLGNVHIEFGRTALALRAFRNALDVNPGLRSPQNLKLLRR